MQLLSAYPRQHMPVPLLSAQAQLRARLGWLAVQLLLATTQWLRATFQLLSANKHKRRATRQLPWAEKRQRTPPLQLLSAEARKQDKVQLLSASIRKRTLTVQLRSAVARKRALAQANADGSVALGQGSHADEAFTVSVGRADIGLTRRITNVAMGARGNDAVTVKQLRKSLKKSFKKGKAKVVKGTIETAAQTSDQDQASTTVAKNKTSTSKARTRSSGGGSRGSGSGGYNTVSQTSFDQFASRTETQIDRLAQRDNKLAEGIAVVAALAQPVLLPGQHFAMRAGWGGYDSANAVAFSAAGVIADNLLRSGHGTLSLDGGVGWGTDEGETVPAISPRSRQCAAASEEVIVGCWCPGAESNHRHADFQSAALPTELPGPAIGHLVGRWALQKA
jgi:hypothetical protein